MVSAMRCLVYFLLLIFISNPLWAMDEDTYVNFAADTLISMHKLRNNPNGLNEWSEMMKTKYPDISKEDTASYEANFAQNPSLKDKVYKRILVAIQAQGYKAKLVEGVGGRTIVEIE